ncbi:hypothetical protein PAJ34TS1_41240 [Paenibacillus azoreducens]
MALVKLMQQLPTEIIIGVIGPLELLPLILQTLKAFPSFVPEVRVYRHEAEIFQQTRELMDQVEVLLFSGPEPYRIAKQQLKLSVPAFYVPNSGTGLYRALFHLDYKSDMPACTVDSISKLAVERVFTELGMHGSDMFYYEGEPLLSRDEVLRFHIQHFEQGKSNAALTGSREISEMLSVHGIPNEWVMPTEQDITVSLERALLSTETRRGKEAQCVIGYISIDYTKEAGGRLFQDKDRQRIDLAVKSFVESLNGHVSNLDEHDYLFITTRGIFEAVTGGYKSIQLAKEIGKEYGIRMSIGAGFGSSASDAGANAGIALRHAKDAGGNICFIVREDRSIIGPLEMAESNECDMSLINNKLLKEAEAAGMSPLHLSKLVVQVARSGRTEYSAFELAMILSITVRSTHRLLSLWLDAGLVEISHEIKAPSKGRPKQIYRFPFLQELVR